jgi:hypothetical protein
VAAGSIGGQKSCTTPWLLQDALTDLSGRSLSSSQCTPYVRTDLPDGALRNLCTEALRCPRSPYAGKGQFRGVTITSVLEAQRHIRTWGSVVTRMDLYEQ